MFHYQTVEELRQAAQEEGVTLPLGGDLSPLGQELEVQGVKLPNRVAIQPMEGCDGTADGKPGELTLRRYDNFARSGAGLLWEEATAVWEEARANPRQLWINEENVGAFQAMNQRIRELSQKENGFAPVIIMQATHSGRYSKPQGVPAPLIAYNNPLFEKDSPLPQERIVSDDYLHRLVERMGEAARLADEIGKTVTELTRTRQAALAARDRFAQNLANIAHQLKTPLTAIIGYADMLRSMELSPKNRFTAAGYIFSEGKRLEALSLKLLDLIVAGKQGVERRRFDAPYLIREVAAVAVPSLAADGMKLDMHWEPGEVEIEPDLFKTLLINLIDNARKASRRGQSVELSGRREDGGYAFYVTDHGRGMRREDLDKITEPFYMIDKSRSRAQNGAGLGLAIAREIVELHGGTISARSWDNQVEFQVTLPKAGREGDFHG